MPPPKEPVPDVSAKEEVIPQSESAMKQHGKQKKGSAKVLTPPPLVEVVVAAEPVEPVEGGKLAETTEPCCIGMNERDLIRCLAEVHFIAGEVLI